MSSTENVRKFRERQKQQGNAEIRGLFAPKNMHDELKIYIRELLQDEPVKAIRK